jgi:hypothetical protein
MCSVARRNKISSYSATNVGAQYGKNPSDLKLKFTYSKIYSGSFIVKILWPVEIRVIIYKLLDRLIVCKDYNAT